MYKLIVGCYHTKQTTKFMSLSNQKSWFSLAIISTIRIVLFTVIFLITSPVVFGEISPALNDLRQWDGSVSMPEGWILRHPFVSSFSANIVTHVSAPDGRLQVELRQFEESFTGIDDGGILTSDLILAGGEARVPTVLSDGSRPPIWLSDGKYHWRARVIDNLGNTSSWQEFGSMGNVDFEILTNQPPVADFTFSPSNPKDGADVFFDASASYDPDSDGTIVLYGWDWDTNGLIDAYSETPFIQHDGFLAGTATTTLYVTDNKGGIGFMTKFISVEQINQNIGSAFILDAFCAAFGGWWCVNTINNDKKDMDTIDEWLRDENGDNVADFNTVPFDWLRGTKCGGAKMNNKQAECLVSALNTQFADGSELTYKAYILSVITEQKMLEQAFAQQHVNTYKLYMNFLVDWLPFKGIIDIFYNNITTSGMIDFLIAAAPHLPYATADIFTYGTSFLSLGMNAIELNETFEAIDDKTYHESLVGYLSRRGTHSHELSWISCNEKAGICTGPGIWLSAILSDAMLSETEIKFNEWYHKYEPHICKTDCIAMHFDNQFKQDLKNDIETLILFAVKNK